MQDICWTKTGNNSSCSMKTYYLIMGRNVISTVLTHVLPISKPMHSIRIIFLFTFYVFGLFSFVFPGLLRTRIISSNLNASYHRQVVVSVLPPFICNWLQHSECCSKLRPFSCCSLFVNALVRFSLLSPVLVERRWAFISLTVVSGLLYLDWECSIYKMLYIFFHTLLSHEILQVSLSVGLCAYTRSRELKAK